MKINKTWLWVGIVIFAGLGVAISLFLGDAPKTLAKIKLSYFASEQEIAGSFETILDQEIKGQKFYWIGVEPGKNEHLDVVLSLKAVLEKHITWDVVYVDNELQLERDFTVKLNAPIEFVDLKLNWLQVGERLKKNESEGKSYLLITASIYSTSLLNKNTYFLIRDKYQITPMTVSMAYFPMSFEDEPKMLFPCRTDDHSGVSDWGCFVANKSRYVRRKIDLKNPKPWVGLMDLTGKNAYALVLNKKL